MHFIQKHADGSVGEIARARNRQHDWTSHSDLRIYRVEPPKGGSAALSEPPNSPDLFSRQLQESAMKNKLNQLRLKRGEGPEGLHAANDGYLAGRRCVWSTISAPSIGDCGVRGTQRKRHVIVALSSLMLSSFPPCDKQFLLASLTEEDK